MISTSEAFEIISKHFSEFETTTIKLVDSFNRILAEDIYAPISSPPFDRVAMDGIALSFKETLHSNEFKIAAILPAGAKNISLNNQKECIEVMTGAILPHNTDTVIRYEDLKIENGLAKITGDISSYSNIHKKGTDFKEGELILKKGTVIKSPHVATLASIGILNVLVYKKPKIKIISTGDELVEIHESPEPYQIRWSNGVTLEVELRQNLLTDVDKIKISDDEKKISDCIEESLNKHDIILLTGGVSKGKFDFIPKVLKDLKVEEVFHSVAQKPGKPLWFGKTKTNKLVFGLPGNPVSSLINLKKYVLPFISGASQLHQTVQLSEELKMSKKLTQFLPVKIKNINGVLKATVIKGNGSGDFYHLTASDGFVELTYREDGYKNNDEVSFYAWGMN